MKTQQTMKRLFLLLITFISIQLTAQQVIQVSPDGTNDILVIKQAIEQVRLMGGEPAIIKLGGGTYHLRRNQATVQKYYISNTMSWNSSPDNLKHIGILLKNIRNLTIDGEGARLITHGEMTSVVIDGCENVTLRNLAVDAADPSVTEMTVESINGNEVTYKVHETSNFQISGTTLRWLGEYGWAFDTNNPIQLYDPQRDITWRTGSPTANATAITNLNNRRIKITYSSLPAIKRGYTYQMRDGVRDQVAGFIHKSKDIVYDKVNMYFMGNFGIVCQFSENLSFTDCRFAPEEGSGRTNAGFADFLQVSGCKGLLQVDDCYFSGAHDDPINVHGTYLKIQNYISSRQVKVKFMHHESWGFEAFFVGDSIEFIDVATMQPIEPAVVTAVQRNDDYNITLTFDRAINLSAYQARSAGVVIENVTWTPEVEIRRNYFSRVPTRGILLTTRRRSVIEDNTFFRMQMAGIYVSGDAANWYESGKVTDLTIRNNRFIECGSPVIYFDPTNSQHNGFVHTNIIIENNTFTIASGLAVGGKSVGKLSFSNNTIIHSGSSSADSYVNLSNSGSITREGNKKLQPGAISLNNAAVEVSSEQTTFLKNAAIDGLSSSQWKARSDDTEKWWMVDLGSTYDLNRIQLLFGQSASWKYKIEVSANQEHWTKVIDQTDNIAVVSSHYNTGNLGRQVRYVKIVFTSTAALAEVNIFGSMQEPLKRGLLTGTVTGTTGSWNNNLSATRDAVFDFDVNTFFDAPASTGWVGLDLGASANVQIDSIRFSPRSEHLDRMQQGVFEISANSLFSSKTILYTVPAIPPFEYQVVPVVNTASGRFVRYVSPSNGFCNIAEIEFYGRSLSTSVTIPSTTINVSIQIDNHSKIITVNLSHSLRQHRLQLYSSSGQLVNDVVSSDNTVKIPFKSTAKGIYVLKISSAYNSVNQKLLL